MLLFFSKYLNNEPTHFKEKIAKSLHTESLHVNYNPFHQFVPKIHTIRRNEDFKYDEGISLEMYYNEGFEYLLTAECLSIQEIFTTYHQGRFEVSIESKYLYYTDILKLAQNDGFPSYETFRDYFIAKMNNNGNYTGFIIHWTDFKY